MTVNTLCLLKGTATDENLVDLLRYLGKHSPQEPDTFKNMDLCL